MFKKMNGISNLLTMKGTRVFKWTKTYPQRTVKKIKNMCCIYRIT